MQKFHACVIYLLTCLIIDDFLLEVLNQNGENKCHVLFMINKNKVCSIVFCFLLLKADIKSPQSFLDSYPTVNNVIICWDKLNCKTKYIYYFYFLSNFSTVVTPFITISRSSMVMGLLRYSSRSKVSSNLLKLRTH